MNQQFRYGENDIFFSTTLKTLARFSPRRVVYDMCVLKKQVYHLLLHCDTHNDFLNHGNGITLSLSSFSLFKHAYVYIELSFPSGKLT